MHFIKQEEDWWKDPFRNEGKRDYFRSQVWYLTQRAKQLIQADLLRAKGNMIILDTLLHSTLIFAKTKLDNKDFSALEDLCFMISNLLPKPDCVVYLYARPEFLYKTRRMQRVKDGSGPKSDVSASLEWITQICLLHQHYFDSWNQTPLLKINVEEVDIKEKKQFLNIFKTIKTFI